MSKRKSKAITKTNRTKANPSRSRERPPQKRPSPSHPLAPASSVPLIVLGYDDQQKPRGARFVDAKPDLVTKAAEFMDLKVYQATSEDVAAIAEKLPVGRLYANGRGFVPNIRQDLYSEVLVTLALEPQAALSLETDKDSLPAARGLPRTWDEIAPGHLVIAQESLDNGWWEAIIIDRKDDVFTLRFRDYPQLPKFFRHRSALALMNPPSE